MYLQIIRHIATVVYSALDYSLNEDEQVQVSDELEQLFAIMTSVVGKSLRLQEVGGRGLILIMCVCSLSAVVHEDEGVDEGIDEGFKRWDDEEEQRSLSVEEFDVILRVSNTHFSQL